MTGIYLLTTCYPPDIGGIEQYCEGLFRELPPGSVTVSAPDRPGAAEFDACQPYRVIRHRTLAPPAWRRRLVPYSRQAVYVPSFLGEPTSDNRGLLDIVPPRPERATVRASLRSVRRVVDDVRPDVVCLSSAFPLGYLAAGLKSSRDVPVLSFTHGIEASVARLPVDRIALRRVARDVDMLTAICDWTAGHIARAVGGRTPVELLNIGVETDMFQRVTDGSAVRRRHGLADAPVCLCVGRLVPRKGHDQLIRAWPRVLRHVPDARLVIVGPGPDERRLRRMAARCADRILVTGGVPHEDIAQYFAVADVFAGPSRSRLGGLDIEGFGTVYLEASAAGLPVIAGRSGGAPESVVEGVTGVTVDGSSTSDIAAAVVALLRDPERSRAMGKAGRQRVESEFTRARAARQLTALTQRLIDG